MACARETSLEYFGALHDIADFTGGFDLDDERPTLQARPVVLPGNLPLLNLPQELCDLILDNCPTSSLIVLATTCRGLQLVVDADERWRAMATRRFTAIRGLLSSPEHSFAMEHGLGSAKERYFTLSDTWLTLAAERGMSLVTIHGHVYDITSFIDEHPGGQSLLLAAAGGDATRAWEYVEHSEHACRILRAYARPDLDLPPEGTLRHLLQANAAETASAPRSGAGEGSSAGGGGGGVSASVGGGGGSWASAALEGLRSARRQALEGLMQTGEYDASTTATSTRHIQCLELLGSRRRRQSREAGRPPIALSE